MRIADSLFLCCAVAATACGGPSSRDQLVTQGRQAETQGNWLAAAQAYDSACQMDPNDSESCRRAQEMRDYAVELGSFNARKQCQAGQLVECVTTLRPIRRVKSRNQAKMLEVVAMASKMAISRCAAKGTSMKDEVTEVGCLQQWQPDLWDNEAFRIRFAERSKHTSDELSKLSAKNASPGARVGYLSAAQCLAPLTNADAETLRASAQAFERQSLIPLKLAYTVNGNNKQAPGTCLEIAAALGGGLRCDIDGPSRPLQINAEVYTIMPRWQQTHQDDQKSARYLAGTRTVDNPDYEQARLEYQLAERRFSEIERVTEEREYRCNDSGSKYDCDQYNSTVSLFNQRQRELSTAKRRANNESPTHTEKVYRDHRYSVRSHRWEAPFRSSIRVGSEAARPEITQVVYTDVEQPGFAEAGIQADAFTPPGPTYYRDQGSRWLKSRLKAYVKAELAARSQKRIDHCDGDELGCWITAMYWRGQTNYGVWLLNGLTHKRAELTMRCSGSLLRR